MSGIMYFLRPKGVDDTSLIEIPAGKLTIGRGPFLKCTEKRVSRNHADLKLTDDGRLYITPTHVNPTFHSKKGDSNNYQPLERGKSCELQAGDCISLLSDSLIFEILTKTRNQESQQSTLADVSEVEMSEVDSSSKQLSITEPAMDSKEDIPKSGDRKSDETARMDTSLNDASDEASESINKTRKLPDWMIEAAGTSVINSAEKEPIKRKRNPKVKVDESKNSKNGQLDNKEVSTKPDSPKVASNSNRPSVQQTTDKPITAETSQVSNTETKLKKTQVSKEKPAKCRPLCEYGEKCYRKNPAHKEEYCHPGNDDYEMSLKNSQSDEEDDDRPECEFGTDCYRKNPQHRRKYKHSKKPQRQAAIKAKRRKADEDENSDEDEYDESFIDDDSDGYDPKKDDADYSSDLEDLEALNSEAKAFMKNKKMLSKT